MEWIMQPEALLALVTLTAIEIVLGIDNIVFLSIMVSKLPVEKQKSARIVGLGLAMFTRILLLLFLTAILKLTKPLFTVFSNMISGRDLILIAGGLFLLAKSTIEIHDNLEGEELHKSGKIPSASYLSVIIQIAMAK